jgi:polysaccharide deacetylase family protein (PEP-CTERM system associated)
VLTVDLEDWFHATYLGVPEKEWRTCEPRIVLSTRRLLDILADCGVKATFFVLGWIAEREPELIRTIVAEGHEIASHSYGHAQVYEQSQAEFTRDLQRSIAALQSAAGVPILGYRAPALSIREEQMWVFDILIQNGIKYDSSVLPVRTPLYGMPDKPRFAYRFCEGQLLEVPLSTVEFGNLRFPIAGGIYMRSLPLSIIMRGIRRLNEVEKQPAVLYLHPWELDPYPPDKGKMEGRIRQILSYYSFSPVCEVFNLGANVLSEGSG